MDKYKAVPTKKQLEIIKKYWRAFKLEEELFYSHQRCLEIAMSQESGIEELKFFNVDGDWCGIGNSDRTMRLLQSKQLDK
jgi:hypothetical protein